MESAESIWLRGRMRAVRASGGGRRRPVASYQAVLHYLRAVGLADTNRLARDHGTSERRMGGRMVALWEYGFVQTSGEPPRWRLSAEGLRLVAALRREADLPSGGIPDHGPGVA